MRKKKTAAYTLPEMLILVVMATIACLGIFLGACSSVQKKATPQTLPSEESPTLGQATPSEGPVPTLYTIRSGDSLWLISKKAYSDPYLWPLIFNQNVNRIADPDLINPGQEIGIPRQYSDTLAYYARHFAFKVPVYQAHAKPNHLKYHPNVGE